MDDLSSPRSSHLSPAGQPISGTYTGKRDGYRLTARVDIVEQHPGRMPHPLNLVSGDIYREIGGKEWEYRHSFVIEHPHIVWEVEQVEIEGELSFFQDTPLAPAPSFPYFQHRLRMTIPLQLDEDPPLATIHLIRWGVQKQVFLCTKTSAYFRSIDLEIDRITGTELPRSFHTHSVNGRPDDLPPMGLDLSSAYQRAGIDLQVVSDTEVFPPPEAGTDLTWNEDELHLAMQHHYSLWQQAPQWKLYLLVASHFELYPTHRVTGIMYDSHYRDPVDQYPRQGAAAFYSTMVESWEGLSPEEFDRNYLRTCVHELGHALNLLHPFDEDRSDSTSWMNYPWRFPYGYHLPSGWDGTHEYWMNFRYRFDLEELRHLRHNSLTNVIPGGSAFGSIASDSAMAAPITHTERSGSPLALYLRTRPERTLFQLAEPITIEVKLKNTGQAHVRVPDMLHPEFGLLTLHIRDPKGTIKPYQPLFKLCGDKTTKILAAGESLYESVFVAFGAGGFYFEEPGEYQIWASYGASEQQLRSNVLCIRVAYPKTPDDEDMALWTFGQEQGHVLYMRGAEHLTSGMDQLREVTERYPTTNLSRYIHYCIGSSQARAFKDAIRGVVRQPQLEQAARALTRASTLMPQTQQAALDNITFGHAVDLLYDVYHQMDQVDQAEPVLSKTKRYFERMKVKQDVIDGIEQRIDKLKAT